MSFVLPNPMNHRGKSYPHTGDLAYLGTQCAAFVQKVFNGIEVSGPAIGVTSSWRPGTKVWPPTSRNQTLNIQQTILPESIRETQTQSKLQCTSLGLDAAPKIQLGTVVATFENGKYPAHNQHVAVFIEYIPNGFRVLDQYANKRIVDFAGIDNHNGRSYDPRRYFVVEVV